MAQSGLQDETPLSELAKSRKREMLDGCNFNEEDGLYIRLKQANITFVKEKSFVANCILMLTCYYSSCDIGAGLPGLGLACQTVTVSWSGLGRHFAVLHGYGPHFEILDGSSPGLISAILGLLSEFLNPCRLLLSIKVLLCLLKNICSIHIK